MLQSAAMAAPVIQLKNLTKRFDKITALNEVSFEVMEGEIFGLLGPNGAGKTTTLSMLATLLPPTSGAATVAGFDILKNPADVRRSIGIVFQNPSSDDLLTGWENLYLHALMFDVPAKLIRSRITDVLKLVGLEDRAHDRVKKYSGGMRRRLELGRGLLHRPKILFLDEPTLGLDPQAREKIWEYIENLVKTEKVTIIITTHYMEEADRLCHRVAIIDYGKIITLGTPRELKSSIGEVARPVEVGPTLNDVFLYYAGREIKNEEPEGGFEERLITFESQR